jgi:hypothetical protein
MGIRLARVSSAWQMRQSPGKTTLVSAPDKLSSKRENELFDPWISTVRADKFPARI